MKIVINGKTAEVLSGGASQEIYDDQERVIGTWYGKPLYRKIVHGQYSSVAKEPLNIPLDPTFFVHKFEGFVGNVSEDHSLIPIDFNLTKVDPNNWNACFYDAVGHQITTWTGKCVNATVYIIIEYTKTTDQGTATISTHAAATLSEAAAIEEYGVTGQGAMPAVTEATTKHYGITTSAGAILEGEYEPSDTPEKEEV